jgi:Xaa-Pro aminopeptidase
MASELEIKSDRLAEFLDRNRLDGVLLQERRNFAWITGGADNHVADDTRVGGAAILATGDGQVCLATSSDAPRMELEELAGRDIDVVVLPWWDQEHARRRLRELIDDAVVACDTDRFGLGLPVLPPVFAELRWSLTAEEIERYREGASRLARAVEETCAAAAPGMNEHEIAGLFADNARRAGCEPAVTLVAADDRIDRFRRPIPTAKRVERLVMIACGSTWRGLTASVTRLVSFGPVPADLRLRHEAVCAVDAVAIAATRPGADMADIVAAMQAAYAERGFPDEWRQHHLGGPTGYSTRELVVTPATRQTVRPGQAFAWNPTVTGTRSEDTIVATEAGGDVLTTSKSWPVIVPPAGGHVIPRPDILVRS